MKTIMVVKNFAPLFSILSRGGWTRKFHGLNVSNAESFGRARGLYLIETLGEFPSWLSIAYSAYVIDEHGTRQVVESPYGPGSHTFKIYNEQPKVKFTHCEAEVHFNLCLGEDWFARCAAFLINGKMSTITVHAIRMPGGELQFLTDGWKDAVKDR